MTWKEYEEKSLESFNNLLRDQGMIELMTEIYEEDKEEDYIEE